MTDLIITHDFVKALAKNIRKAYGKDVSHTKAIELIAQCLGWKPDALMHRLKSDTSSTTKGPVSEEEDLLFLGSLLGAITQKNVGLLRVVPTLMGDEPLNVFGKCLARYALMNKIGGGFGGEVVDELMAASAKDRIILRILQWKLDEIDKERLQRHRLLSILEKQKGGDEFRWAESVILRHIHQDHLTVDAYRERDSSVVLGEALNAGLLGRVITTRKHDGF